MAVLYCAKLAKLSYISQSSLRCTVPFRVGAGEICMSFGRHTWNHRLTGMLGARFVAACARCHCPAASLCWQRAVPGWCFFRSCHIFFSFFHSWARCMQAQRWSTQLLLQGTHIHDAEAVTDRQGFQFIPVFPHFMFSFSFQLQTLLAYSDFRTTQKPRG